jgi:hypothetical protein
METWERNNPYRHDGDKEIKGVKDSDTKEVIPV